MQGTVYVSALLLLLADRLLFLASRVDIMYSAYEVHLQARVKVYESNGLRWVWQERGGDDQKRVGYLNAYELAGEAAH